MARQSATARKRRTRSKRASADARKEKVDAAQAIESAPEPGAPIAEQNIAPAESIAAAQEPEPAAEPIAAVEEPEPAAAPVTPVPERFVPAERPLTLVRVPDPPTDEPVVSAEGPAMPAPAPIRTPAECKARLDRITLQWCDLAERRLQYYTELYRSGRWRRYYTEERFVVVMNEVARAVANWRALADRMAPTAASNDDLRLSA
jgi:hypothetical protein